MHMPVAIAKELVLIGGGHSHVIVLKMLAMNPIPGLQVTLVSPDVLTPYSGMLPGLVAGHYSAADIHIDLVPLCRYANVRFIQTRAYNIDPVDQVIACENRPNLRYDVLSIDIGITPSLDVVPGALEYVLPVKPISQFLDHWRVFLTKVATAQDVGTPINDVGIVGGGAGGLELCFAINYYLNTHFENAPKVHLYTADKKILKSYPESVQNRFIAMLEQAKIELHLNFRVEAVCLNTPLTAQSRKQMSAVSGEQQVLDEIFWVTMAASQGWLADTQLALDENGFLLTRETLQTLEYDNIFAAGDIAHVQAHPRPKAGVYAVRQGPVLFNNIRRFILGEAVKGFTPQKEFLSLVSAGGKYALGSKGRFQLEGKFVWKWKHWIDSKFMDRFNRLPKMKVAKPQGLLADFDAQMHCGGCGSKVAANILTEVLANLDIEVSDLDDAAIYHVPKGHAMLHSVDSFRAFVSDPYIFAQTAVHHALSDIYAMGGKPVTALAIITVPYGKPSVVRDLLMQLMAGANKVINDEGLKLVGGHTTEGSELSIGFSVNGIVEPTKIMRKSNLETGDVLILTKALGTGTLFAADMQYAAAGDWINGALASMLQSNQAAAEIFTDANVLSCTDITGFGLAGHLTEMLKASVKAVKLDLAKLPILNGALTTINKRNIFSTLHTANAESADKVSQSTHPHFQLLFDPQTSGGLLAAVKKSAVDLTLTKLRDAGYCSATAIGTICEGAGEITFNQYK